MDSLAASLGSAGTWLVIIGAVMFVAGFLVDVFGTSKKEAQSGTGVIGEVIRKAFRVAFEKTRPPGQRMSAGGVLLIGLGLIAMLGGLIAGAASGAGGSTTPTGSSSPSHR
jgi:uncharacterized membrane protein